jgi:hypothetical protein
MNGQPGRVRLEVPADSRYVIVTRLAMGAVGPVAGLDEAGVDDLRLAVDELCSSLVEASGHGQLEVRCEVGTGGIDVTGRAPADSVANVDLQRLHLSERILDAVCESHSLRVDGGVGEFHLVKRAA